MSSCSADTMTNAIKQTQPIHKLQAVEAVWGQKRPHYAVVRLREMNMGVLGASYIASILKIQRDEM